MSSDEITYTICFCDGESHALQPLLKSGFSHCFAIKHAEHYYIVVNSSRSRVDVDALLPTRAAFNDLTDGYTTITITIKEEIKGSIAGFRWLSCVESVKSLLGMKSWRVLTPYQLYRYLKCQGKVQQNAQPSSKRH